MLVKGLELLMRVRGLASTVTGTGDPLTVRGLAPGLRSGLIWGFVSGLLPGFIGKFNSSRATSAGKYRQKIGDFADPP